MLRVRLAGLAVAVHTLQWVIENVVGDVACDAEAGMIEDQIDSEPGDFMGSLMIGRDQASFPYEFRKKTGRVIEVNFVAGRTLELIHEVLSVARVLHAGLDILRMNASLVEQLRGQTGQTASGGELLANDLHPLHSIVIVNLDAAIDAGIDDTLIVALRFRPGVVAHLAGLGVKKLPTPVDRDLTYSEAGEVLKRLKAWTSSESTVPNGWLRRLEAVGLPIALDESYCCAIREMVYVRNCIVHRAQRADAACARDVSILQVTANQKIRVTKQAMGAYAAACLKLASAIADAAQRESPFL